MNDRQRMPLSILSVDGWGEDIENSKLGFETGDADGICDHTGHPIVLVNWTSRPSALIMFWMGTEDGVPIWVTHAMLILILRSGIKLLV